MKIKLDGDFPEYYIEVEPSLYGLALWASVDDNEVVAMNLTRAQAVELVTRIMQCFFPENGYSESPITIEELSEMGYTLTSRDRHG